MRTILVTAVLLAFAVLPARAGSYQGTWPNIGTNKSLDALQCATQAIHKTDQTWNCAATSPRTAGNTAAECLFVMVLSGEKVRWRLEGKYDANSNWTGAISRTYPSCTGFLCGYVGQVWWSGRNTNPASYSYQWVGTGNTAGCDVSKKRPNESVTGLFYGSY